MTIKSSIEDLKQKYSYISRRVCASISWTLYRWLMYAFV